MTDNQPTPSASATTPKKRIILNGFDVFTPGHLSFGQWKHPSDRASTKRRSLSYWTDLARILEKGNFNALFLADSFGLHDTYQGKGDTAIRKGTQFPMGDPSTPVSAMASVTKNLGFAITTSTSYEAAYVVAKRFSTMNHLTGGRFGWNIVTSWKESASRAVGLPLVEHDKRYEIANEYMTVLYKLWEGSWSDEALKEDAESGVYTDPSQLKFVHHHGDRFHAGTSPAGIAFGSKHAEGIFVSAPSPHILAPRIKVIREAATKAGRDSSSVKVFAIFTPILGKTEDDANEKYQEALKYASAEGGLAFYSSNIGVDLSKFPLDQEIKPSDIHIDARVHSSINTLSYHGADVPEWTPRNIGKHISIGGNGPVAVGTPERVADIMIEWVRVADLDGFNIGYVWTPGTFEDVVELIVPELRRRGIYAPVGEGGTMRERIYGSGQRRIRDDHPAARYRYEVYDGNKQSGQKDLKSQPGLNAVYFHTYQWGLDVFNSRNDRILSQVLQ